jgi:hypothetical protein
MSRAPKSKIPEKAINKTPRVKPVPRDVREFLASKVAGGFASPGEILQKALEDYEEELEGVPGDQVELALDKLLEAHKVKQARWERPTDNDRLDRAFCILDEQGIIARQNWTFCQTDGVDEMEDEIEAARAAGRPVRGFVFYHSQDVDDAVDGGEVMLSFGAWPGNSKKLAREVGETIVRVCSDEGLTVYWKGDPGQRIEIMMDWKRRR